MKRLVVPKGLNKKETKLMKPFRATSKCGLAYSSIKENKQNMAGVERLLHGSLMAGGEAHQPAKFKKKENQNEKGKNDC